MSVFTLNGVCVMVCNDGLQTGYCYFLLVVSICRSEAGDFKRQRPYLLNELKCTTTYATICLQKMKNQVKISHFNLYFTASCRNTWSLGISLCTFTIRLNSNEHFIKVFLKLKHAINLTLDGSPCKVFIRIFYFFVMYYITNRSVRISNVKHQEK